MTGEDVLKKKINFKIVYPAVMRSKKGN